MGLKHLLFCHCYKAVGVCRPLVSTVIARDEDQRMIESLDRRLYVASEMPQAFQTTVIMAAYEQVYFIDCTCFSTIYELWIRQFSHLICHISTSTVKYQLSDARLSYSCINQPIFLFRKLKFPSLVLCWNTTYPLQFLITEICKVLFSDSNIAFKSGYGWKRPMIFRDFIATQLHWKVL